MPNLRYFVSYTGLSTSGAQLYGCAEVHLDRKITSMNDLNVARDKIVESGKELREISIINWKLLKTSSAL